MKLILLILVSVSCCLASIVASQAANKQLRLQLHKQETGQIDSLTKFQRELQAITARQDRKSRPVTGGREVAPAVSYVSSSDYVTDITLGTPPQKFNVRFSTMMSNLFVTSVNCKSPACKDQKKYDSKKSSTHKEDGRHFNWADGLTQGLDGNFSFDDLQLNGLKVKEVPFGEINFLVYNDHVQKVDGFFGLSWDDYSYYNFSTPLDYMVKQGAIKERVFSFYWNETSSKGEIIFGEPDSDKGKINYVSLDYNIWDLRMDGISVNGSQLYDKPVEAAFSVDFKQHHGNKLLLRKLNYKLGAQPAPHIGQGVYEFDCSKLDQIPKLALHIKGVEYVNKPSELVTHLHDANGKEYCISNYIANSAWPFIDFGAAFIGPHYTVFDMDQKRMGFTQ